MICARCGEAIRPYRIPGSPWNGRPPGTIIWILEINGYAPCISATENLGDRVWRDDELHTPITIEDVVARLRAIEEDLR